MNTAPVPEDVIVHRGTVLDSFTIGGQRLTGADAARLQQIVGTVQRDHGYMSTSVGVEAAFSHQPVQIKFRVPAGTPAAYVKSFSNFSREREMILARGTHFYVHDVYRSGSKWIVEAEVVPSDFEPPLQPDGAPILLPSAERWTK